MIYFKILLPSPTVVYRIYHGWGYVNNKYRKA